jgi:hypothetical protein
MISSSPTFYKLRKANSRTPINGIKPAKQDKCVDEIVYYDQTISNLLIVQTIKVALKIILKKRKLW